MTKVKNQPKQTKDKSSITDGFSLILSDDEVSIYPEPTSNNKKVPLPFLQRDRIPRTPTQALSCSSIAALDPNDPVVMNQEYIHQSAPLKHQTASTSVHNSNLDLNNFTDSYEQRNNKYDADSISEGRYIDDLEEEDAIEAFDGDDEHEHDTRNVHRSTSLTHKSSTIHNTQQAYQKRTSNNGHSLNSYSGEYSYDGHRRDDTDANIDDDGDEAEEMENGRHANTTTSFAGNQRTNYTRNSSFRYSRRSAFLSRESDLDHYGQEEGNISQKCRCVLM